MDCLSGILLAFVLVLTGLVTDVAALRRAKTDLKEKTWYDDTEYGKLSSEQIPEGGVGKPSIDFEDDKVPNSPDLHHKRLQKANRGLTYGLGCSTHNLTVAVIIAGLSRDMVTSKWTSAFESNMISPISQAGARGMAQDTPDVFVHVTLGKGAVASDRQHSGHNYANTKEYVLAALKEIHPTNFTIEEGNGAGYDFSLLGNPSCYGRATCVNDCRKPMAYYHSINGAFQQLQKKEKLFSRKYDFVIFLRPDADFFPGQEYVKSVQCQKSLFITDHFSLQLREHAEVFGNIWNDEFLTPNPDMCNKHIREFEDFVRHAMTKMEGGSKVYR